ncbi:MAG: hypothetical protein AAF728_14855 [Cyanobacteria bacterium P01_D01_bin.128]
MLTSQEFQEIERLDFVKFGVPESGSFLLNLEKSAMDIEMQRRASLESALFGQFDTWIKDQIRQLSVSTMAAGVFTCTACGEVAGDYIVDYQGETFRFDTITTYAFLRFILEKA